MSKSSIRGKRCPAGGNSTNTPSAPAAGTTTASGLYDAILIKDNHIADIPTAQLAERLTELLGQQSGSPSFVEVEVDNLEQFAEVCKVDAVDIVLLDNFTLDQLRSAVAQRDSLGRQGQPELEASGGIRLESIAEIAATGIDRISIGGLTHSAAALDLALDP